MTKPLMIVPILTPERVAATPLGNLTYHGGHLLTAVEVVPIFWGSAWPPQRTTVSSVNRFFDYILTSPLIDLLSEYSVAGQVIGRGRRKGSIIIPDQLGGEVRDSDIQQTLQAWIGITMVPRPNSNTLYFIYLPPGITSIDPNGTRSCQGMCGYHFHVGNTIFYGVIPYVTCSGCTDNRRTIDVLTTISSHELCEAITDPIPGQGWYDDQHGEIGDICAPVIEQTAGYTIQGEWSNSAHACIIRRPPPVGSPFHVVQATPNADFGSWSGLSDAAGLGQLAVISTYSGGLEVFAADTFFGVVVTIFQDGPNGNFEGWVNMGAPYTGLGQIAVGKNEDGRLEVFGTDSNLGQAWHAVQPTPSDAFGGWSTVGDAEGLGQIVVGSNADGRLEVFAVQRK